MHNKIINVNNKQEKLRMKSLIIITNLFKFKN